MAAKWRLRASHNQKASKHVHEQYKITSTGTTNSILSRPFSFDAHGSKGESEPKGHADFGEAKEQVSITARRRPRLAGRAVNIRINPHRAVTQTPTRACVGIGAGPGVACTSSSIPGMGIDESCILLWPAWPGVSINRTYCGASVFSRSFSTSHSCGDGGERSAARRSIARKAPLAGTEARPTAHRAPRDRMRGARARQSPRRP